MEKPEIEPCNGKQIKLLILIMSRRDTLYKRMGIRKSWAKDKHEGMVIRYVIGGHTADEKNSTILDIELKAEQKEFGDLIFNSIPDGYANLHFKMGAAFQWQQKWCSNAEFVMKTDDDTIVDLPRWEFWTEKKFKKELKNGPAFFGIVFYNSKPIRDSRNKWFVPVKHFSGQVYPRYMQGASYFGNGKAINLIMSHTKEVIGFNMDDIVFTGTLADVANVSRIHLGYHHFRGGHPIYKDEMCEQGQPLLFSFFKTFKNDEEYIKAYEEIHNIKCKIK